MNEVPTNPPMIHFAFMAFAYKSFSIIKLIIYMYEKH